jgi:hypothetical protein
VAEPGNSVDFLTELGWTITQGVGRYTKKGKWHVLVVPPASKRPIDHESVSSLCGNRRYLSISALLAQTGKTREEAMADIEAGRDFTLPNSNVFVQMACDHTLVDCKLCLRSIFAHIKQNGL